MRSRDFRGLLHNYVDEIADPQHKKEQEDYLLQLEEQGDTPKGCVLLRPEVGCCVKTDLVYPNGVYQKCFINVCYSPWIQDFTLEQRDGGAAVNLPYSIAAPRPDKDKHGNACLTFDVCVSTNTFGQCHRQPALLRILIESCTERVNACFLKGGERIHPDFQVLRKLRCKGDLPGLTSIREDLLCDKEAFWRQRRRELEARRVKRQEAGEAPEDAVTPKDLRKLAKKAKVKSRVVGQRQISDQERGGCGGATGCAAPDADSEVPHGASPARQSEKDDDNDSIQSELHAKLKKEEELKPGEFRIIHQGTVDLSELFGEQSMLPMHKTIPENLRVEIHVGASVASSAELNVAVSEDNRVVSIHCKQTKAEIQTVSLPFAVDSACGRAQFFPETHRLQLTLPVLRAALRAQGARETPSASDEATSREAAPCGESPRGDAAPLSSAEDVREAVAAAEELSRAQKERQREEELRPPALSRAAEESPETSADPQRNGDSEKGRCDSPCLRAPAGGLRKSALHSVEAGGDFQPRDANGEPHQPSTLCLREELLAQDGRGGGRGRNSLARGGLLEVSDPEFSRIAQRVAAAEVSKTPAETLHTARAAPLAAKCQGLVPGARRPPAAGGASSQPQRLEFEKVLLVRENAEDARDAFEVETATPCFVECVDTAQPLGGDAAGANEPRARSRPHSRSPQTEGETARVLRAAAPPPEDGRFRNAARGDADDDAVELAQPEVIETQQNLLLRFALPPACVAFNPRDSKIEVHQRDISIRFRLQRTWAEGAGAAEQQTARCTSGASSNTAGLSGHCPRASPPLSPRGDAAIPSGRLWACWKGEALDALDELQHRLFLSTGDDALQPRVTTGEAEEAPATLLQSPAQKGGTGDEGGGHQEPEGERATGEAAASDRALDERERETGETAASLVSPPPTGGEGESSTPCVSRETKGKEAESAFSSAAVEADAVDPQPPKSDGGGAAACEENELRNELESADRERKGPDGQGPACLSPQTEASPSATSLSATSPSSPLSTEAQVEAEKSERRQDAAKLASSCVAHVVLRKKRRGLWGVAPGQALVWSARPPLLLGEAPCSHAAAAEADGGPPELPNPLQPRRANQPMKECSGGEKQGGRVADARPARVLCSSIGEAEEGAEPRPSAKEAPRGEGEKTGKDAGKARGGRRKVRIISDSDDEEAEEGDRLASEEERDARTEEKEARGVAIAARKVEVTAEKVSHETKAANATSGCRRTESLCSLESAADEVEGGETHKTQRRLAEAEKAQRRQASGAPVDAPEGRKETQSEGTRERREIEEIRGPALDLDEEELDPKRAASVVGRLLLLGSSLWQEI
ncbi:hypothetical protein BESB_004350 [Besnoitia besnoiti]|uniref:PIH1 N-terminal domain-containing protein n=1 Tax=Besnoitia besnoiti TaxID=94643 RepID=A0A2A9MLG4_BESBE|nr:hypothetical protein BESB_004350 [Besnoitia besnoiti]PFH38094.1 hypothetical protein BESB_004350 [Besnoitia besnoiti]